MIMASAGGLSEADKTALHATRTAWQQHWGSVRHRQAMHELVVRLTEAGIRQEAIAAELRVTAATVGLWRSGRGKPRRTAQARRPPTSDELAQLQDLLERVDYSGRGYAWSSPTGREFLTAARACVTDGVSAMSLADHIAAFAEVGPDAILRQLGGPPRRIRRGQTITQRHRTRKTPDEARVPRLSRPATPEEWTHLLALHHAAGQRGGQYPAAHRAALEQRLLDRDREILRLWADRVADSHIADLLGMSEAAIARARRRARRLLDSPAPRRRAAPTKPPQRRTRHLTGAQAELLRAAWERVRTGPYRYGSNPHIPTFARLVADQRRTGVQLGEIAATLGVSRTTLRSALTADRPDTPPT